ncbi:uncharacterized protein cd34 [Ictalurus furcatus]|uniref:uncharacterized protein cd34 n=1 Tax=Ictalurus furcatus TaxID=66913 RepID=UPI002350301E|nr:uncharacterized protein cd34 [Ictalurus furcatus]
MAMRRMNEMCRRMALTLVFYVLLFHTYQGQTETTVAIQTNTVTQPISTQTFPRVPDPSDPSTTNPTNKPTEGPTTEVSQGTSQGTTKDTLLKLTELQTDTYPLHTQISEILSTSEETTSQLMAKNGDDHPKSSENNNNNTENNSPNETNVISVKHQSPNYVNPTPHTQGGDRRSLPIFTSLLVSGIILAAVLVGVYIWKNHCRTNANSMKLAEESYMADEDNQGNTLVSVAPLNPLESQEKPSQNGESLEAVKTQNPPAATNGHSTTKADTEL